MNPNGCNISYDAQFEALRNEICRTGDINFDLVEQNSLTLLKEKSKDLRVIVYLSLVYLRNEEWEKYVDVFEGLSVIAERNFDLLYPDRERARLLALKWLSEDRYTGLLNGKNPGVQNHGNVLRLLKALQKLRSVLEKKFGERSPFPAGLLNTAMEWQISTNPAVAVSSLAGSEIDVKSDIDQKQIQNRIKEDARLLIEKEPLKGSGYRIMRSIRWDLLKKAPPSENGKSLIGAPDPGQRNMLWTLWEKKEWKRLLEKSEIEFWRGAGHVWLDLQRYIAAACSGLGSQYCEVRDAVIVEMACLLQRVPELLTMSFSDGTPFCDEATKCWVEQDVIKVSADEDCSDDLSVNGEDSFGMLQKKADVLCAEGKYEEAIGQIKSCNGMTGGRENFRRSLLIAGILLKASQADSAVLILESLSTKTEQIDLDLWEPELAIETGVLLLKAYREAKMSAEIRQNRQKLVLNRILRLDPVKWLHINKQ
ncbi:MAG: type VI secretion system protein [Fibrobacter sp.]|nr:type VI secretion system protein [Fibrobacter sp.]